MTTWLEPTGARREAPPPPPPPPPPPLRNRCLFPDFVAFASNFLRSRSSPIKHCILHPPLPPTPLEPQPFSDLLREDPRPALLHGGSLPGGHAHLDGRHSNGGRGIHAVHELRDLADWRPGDYERGRGAGDQTRELGEREGDAAPWFRRIGGHQTGGIDGFPVESRKRTDWVGLWLLIKCPFRVYWYFLSFLIVSG